MITLLLVIARFFTTQPATTTSQWGAGAGDNLTTGDNNIDIGNEGVAGEENTIRIGGPVGIGGAQPRTFITGIRGVTTGNANAIPVVIDSNGQLGTMSSSRRFKHEIKRMGSASEAILGLKPVTFQYKSNKAGTLQFGLIAEEVAEVNPNLVVRDNRGEIYTVRYEAVNAMLLNEFLKEHRRVEEQQATIRRLETTVAKQEKGLRVVTARLEEQAAQIQQVSAQVEANKFATGRIHGGGPAPQIVVDNY
jgi:Chaperone of endosialidase